MNTREELTKQEVKVLALVAQGWRTARIAQELFISPRTVESHLARVFEKLGVSSRTEAAIYALQTNLTISAEFRRNPEDILDHNLYS
jgi:two-component system NarL family response regulator